MAQSSAEAEYITIGLAAQQVIWLKRILEDIGEKQKEVLVIIATTNQPLQLQKIQFFTTEQSI